MINLMHGDCLELMKTISDGSVDMILTDPPYGTTACKWDSVIDFDLMWLQLKRIIKPSGAIALFGAEPFSSALRMSNIKNFKYDWYWEKTSATNHLNAKKQPLRLYEIISLFYEKQATYNPQGLKKGVFKNSRPSKSEAVGGNKVYGQEREYGYSEYGCYPKNKLLFSNPNNKNLHPTQKPVALLEYLIKTYTQENETVLDFTAGSMSTAIACINTNRKGIMIEMDEHYFKVGSERVANALRGKSL